MSLLMKCFFEFLGTLVLVLLGDGVCAANSLEKTKGHGGGWVVITLGWGFAVMCGVFIAGPYSGAHLNPALTVGLAIAGKFAWSAVLPYAIAQLLGGFIGAALVYVFYKDHYDATPDGNVKLGTFCTMPAIPNNCRNLFCEFLASWLLVFCIMAFSLPENTAVSGLGASGAFPVTMLIMSIGMSLGSTTGYAINPARDFPPRCLFSLVSRKENVSCGWGYAWIPIVGPLLGAAFAALTFNLIY
ncbi:MAG: aquaporin family protein [Bacteroidales bacterium]|nr:aquaporin family protein [Candidatus Cacconaster scatequi]